MKLNKDWRTISSYIVICAMIGASFFAGTIYQAEKDLHATQESNNTTEANDIVADGVDAGTDIVAEEPTVSGNVINEFQVSKGTKDVHTATLTPEGSAPVTFNVPEEHYYLTQSYIDTVAQTYGIDATLACDNLIVTGNADSVYGAEEAVNATTISGLRQLMSELYGDTVDIDALAYSEAYQYMVTNNIPETSLLNYSIELADTIVKDGITYKAYHVSYDVDSYGTGNEEDYIHSEQIMCYSDTEDPIEIIIYTGEYNQERALSLLHTFIE